MFARSTYAYAHEIRCKGTKKNEYTQAKRGFFSKNSFL